MNPPFLIIKSWTLLGTMSEAEENKNWFPGTDLRQLFRISNLEGDE